MKSTLFKPGVVLFSLVILTGACSKSSTPSGSSSAGGSGSASTMQIGPDTANNKGSKNVSGASKVDVLANDFYFSPTVLTGTPGQKLTITLKNGSASTTHNFSIAAQSINQDLTPGATATVTVKFPQTGFVEFYCRFHRVTGMVGELTTG